MITLMKFSKILKEWMSLNKGSEYQFHMLHEQLFLFQWKLKLQTEMKKRKKLEKLLYTSKKFVKELKKFMKDENIKNKNDRSF